MKKLLATFIIVLSLCSLSYADPNASADLNQVAMGPQPSAMPTSQEEMVIPSAPSVNAQSYVLMDANSGMIIAQKNMDQRRQPASLTKLMSLYLVSHALSTGVIHLDDKVRISKKAWQTGGSRMFVKVGTDVPVSDLIQGIIVDSGNDATMALAEYAGGSEDTFTQMMNQQAQALGMVNTHFEDPTGLPKPEHYTTAHDLAILARAVWLQYPQYHSWYGQKWLTYNHIRQSNRNRLLWRYPYALGMKTGHTEEAGFCLIAVAKQNGMTLISVVLGAPTDEARSDDSIRLLSYGFRFYESHLLYGANTAISHPRVWFGSSKVVPVGSPYDVYVTTPVGQFKHVVVSNVLQNHIKAPVTQGQQLGSLQIALNEKTVGSYPLVALTNDVKGGVWRHMMDSIGYHVSHWFGHKKTVSKVSVSTAPATAS